jgi:hypothetical protein
LEAWRNVKIFENVEGLSIGRPFRWSSIEKLMANFPHRSVLRGAPIVHKPLQPLHHEFRVGLVDLE